MWMYDLTGGWRIGKLHKRVSRRRRPLATCRPCPSRAAQRRLPLLRRRRRRRPARRLTVARTAAQRGAVVANRCRVVGITTRRRRSTPTAPSVDADGERDPRAGALRRQRRRRVGRRRARARRGHRPRLDPTGQGRAHHDPVGEGPQRHRRRHPGAAATSAACSSCRGASSPTARSATSTSAPPTPTTTARSTTRSARATTSTTYCGAQRGARPTTVTARRHHRRLGRAAPAREGGVGRRRQRKTADLSRRHQVAVSDSGVVRVNGGKLTTYREMAEDTVDVVVRRLDAPRRARRSTTRRLPLFGATDGYRSSRHDRAPRRPPGHAATARQADEIRALDRVRPGARRTARARPALPARRGRVRGPPRDGDHARRRARAADPRPPVRPIARRSPPPPTSPTCSPPNSAGTPPRPNANSTHYRALCHAEEAAARASARPTRSHDDTAGAAR